MAVTVNAEYKKHVQRARKNVQRTNQGQRRRKVKEGI